MSGGFGNIEIAACPAVARPVLARYTAGEISAEVALMQLLLALGGVVPLTECLAALAAATPERPATAALLRVAAAHRAQLAGAVALVESGLARDRAGSIDAIREQFDRAVAIAPEAAVALYSLGSAATLDRATGEIVDRLAAWRLLSPDTVALDIGCGIGRLEAALAPRLGAITGIDVSPAMIDEARRRCAGLDNADFACCTGSDLAAFTDRRFDLVLAVDAFPYLVAADPALGERHAADVARLLRRGGALVILNFSYCGDLAADRVAVGDLAARYGFRIDRNGTRDFTLWDGATFLLRKAP